jgi:hypothetical protein
MPLTGLFTLELQLLKTYESGFCIFAASKKKG